MDLAELSALFESRAADADLPARYRGTLLGVAVGNALGLPAEGLSRRTLAARFPGGLTARVLEQLAASTPAAAAARRVWEADPAVRPATARSCAARRWRCAGGAPAGG